MHLCIQVDLSFPTELEQGQAAVFTGFYHLLWKRHSLMTFSRLCRCFFSTVC